MTDPEETEREALAWALNDAGMEGPDRLKYADAIIARGYRRLSESEIRRDQAEATMSEFEGYVTNMAETPDIRDHAYQLIAGYNDEQGLFATPSPETEQEPM